MLLTTYIKLSGLVTLSVQEHVMDVMDTFQIEVNEELATAEATAARIAEYEELVSAVQAGNISGVGEAVKKYYESSGMETNNITITDARGNVLFRLHSDTAGDSLATQDCVAAAMEGRSKTSVSTGTTIRMGARSGAPIRNNQRTVIGTVSVTYPFDDNVLVDKVKGSASTEYTIFVGDERLSTTLVDNGQRMVGTKMSGKIADIVLTKGQEYIGEATILGKSYTSMYRPIKDDSGKAIGALFSGVLTEEIIREEQTALLESILIAVIVAVAAVICIIAFTNKVIVKPIVTLAREMERISRGDLKVAIAQGGNNEIGTLTDSLRLTVETLQGYIGDISENLNDMASGDMTIQVHKDYIGDFAPIKDSLVKISDSLNETLSAINTTAAQVSSGSEQVSSGAQALAQGSTEQASSVQELAATINDISAKINATAESAKTAEHENQVSSQQLSTCSERMEELVAAMRTIDDKSKEISKVIKTIEDIAFQTNILALNAAVEAARAGTAGKGFAVVADEVRNLANKSQEAAQSTTVLIDETVRAVAEGASISGATEEALAEVVTSAQKVLDAVTQISNATKEQAGALVQVSAGIEQISTVVQTNAATAEQSAATSEELSGQANILHGEIAQFKLRRGN